MARPRKAPAPRRTTRAAAIWWRLLVVLATLASAVGAELVQATPAAAATGRLEVCKQVDNPVLQGPFSLVVGGQLALLAPGQCQSFSVSITNPFGGSSTRRVSELPGNGFSLCGIDISPPSANSGTDVSAGSALVRVTSNSTSRVTFRNCYSPPPPPAPPQVQICKQVNNASLNGVAFPFTAGDQDFLMFGGDCRLITLAVGTTTTTVREFQGAGNSTLCNVNTSPSSALSNVTLGTGTAVVKVTGGTVTVVRFVNCALAPPPPTQLRVCKQADPELLATFFHPATVFQFNVGGQFFTLTGGNCRILTVPPGINTVTEASGSNFNLCAVTTAPASALISTNLAAGQAQVNVPAGTDAGVTFRNCYSPPAAQPTTATALVTEDSPSVPSAETARPVVTPTAAVSVEAARAAVSLEAARAAGAERVQQARSRAEALIPE